MLVFYTKLDTLMHRQANKKIGRLEYSIGKYERLIRTTIPIPIRLFGKEDDESKFYYLLLSFDLNSNVMDVIENKIMPFIRKSKERKL